VTEAIYKKQGRRYVQIGAYDPLVYDAMPQGAHLVIVDKGWTSTRRSIDPDRAGLLSALKLHEDVVTKSVRKATEIKMAQRRGDKLTPRELKAFAAYRAVMGEDEMLMLNGPAVTDVVRALEDALMSAIYGEDQA
jgi:hypothetical protein